MDIPDYNINQANHKSQEEKFQNSKKYQKDQIPADRGAVESGCE